MKPIPPNHHWMDINVRMYSTHLEIELNLWKKTDETLASSHSVGRLCPPKPINPLAVDGDRRS